MNIPERLSDRVEIILFHVPRRQVFRSDLPPEITAAQDLFLKAPHIPLPDAAHRRIDRQQRHLRIFISAREFRVNHLDAVLPERRFAVTKVLCAVFKSPAQIIPVEEDQFQCARTVLSGRSIQQRDNENTVSLPAAALPDADHTPFDERRLADRKRRHRRNAAAVFVVGGQEPDKVLHRIDLFICKRLRFFRAQSFQFFNLHSRSDTRCRAAPFFSPAYLSHE